MTTTRACSALMAGDDTSVTLAASRIGDLAGRRVERPVVGRRVEDEPNHAECPCDTDLAVGGDRREVPQPGPTGPDHELADARCLVLAAAGILRPEPLVIVVVPIDD